MKHLREIRQFLEHLGDALVLVNADSDIVYANPACHKLFGYPASSLEGHTLNDLIAQPMPSGQHEKLVRQFIERRAEAKPMMIRGSMLCRDRHGKAFSAKISISVVEIGGEGYGVAVIQDFTPVQQELDTLKTASRQDALTGLYNRRFFHEAVNLDTGPISQWNIIGIIYMDLDDFKPVNDTHGHHVGDKVLTQVAQRLEQRLRNEDLAIRMGGDEFLCFINLSGQEVPEEKLLQVARQLQDVISQPMCVDALQLSVHASAGYALFPHQGESITDLIHQADHAMYLAKQQGSGLLSIRELPDPKT